MGGNTPPRPPPQIVENERPGAGQAIKNVQLYYIEVRDFPFKFQVRLIFHQNFISLHLSLSCDNYNIYTLKRKSPDQSKLEIY